MIFNKNTAKKTAEVLLHINAIKLSPKAPFTLVAQKSLGALANAFAKATRCF